MIVLINKGVQMKKFLLLIALLLVGNYAIAQEDDKLFLLFEFMEVDNEQESSYAEVEEFWEKIHVQRVKNGDCIGWDLWSLQPSGENQDFQYLTVSLYNDPVKMMDGGNFNAAYQAAYPNLSQEESDAWFEKTANSRNLAVRVYFEMIDNARATDFDMPLGTLAILNFMKAKPGMAQEYERMESEIFKPMHQKDIDAGGRGSWGLLRNMLWYPTEIYATHMAVDMFTGYDQFFNGPDGNDGSMTQAEWNKVMSDMNSARDLRQVKHARLIRKVRAAAE